MTSKERVQKVLNHQSADKIPVDFGATPVSGIHVRAIDLLRKHYGLEQKPIKVTEPYQMLGEIEDDLMDILGVDVISIGPKANMFGIPQEGWKTWTTHWGQTLLVPKNFNVSDDGEGGTLIYPEGDTSVPASARMPKDSYFFDAIVRQEPIDDARLNVEDNLEEFKKWTDADIEYWKEQAKILDTTDKAVIANFGGTGLGDIALVPGMFMKHPKGIRDIAEWYMSTMMRPDYIKELYDKQTDVAIYNLSKAYEIVGNKIEAIFLCGTDFGTQDSTFCGPETYMDLWYPYYKKINDWIHENTTWKCFKHSCGAVESFMEMFIESGFEIINPVQINATGMDPQLLKDKYGDRLTFWGGGIDTQKMMPFGTPQEVKEQVTKQCEILSKNGGFVFNTVHNIQANTPLENMVAMIDALNEFNKN